MSSGQIGDEFGISGKPSTSRTLNSSQRYFWEGIHAWTINQNTYKGSLVKLGEQSMNDGSTYRLSADNYNPSASGFTVWDYSHFYD